MRAFPSNITFKYSWRAYQNRVLEELREHLDDDHLHIIAPPGSGKTVLGLEVALQLNKPTLIFAPTVAIRNQWIQRFCELFLQVDQTPEWISWDIKTPKFLTVATYQALHAACSNSWSDEGSDEEETMDSEKQENSNSKTHEIVRLLKAQNIGTVVMDEAHHLRNAWWQSLDAVKRALNPTIVGLTATPPYDVSPLEWEHYIDLNGPVDAEISVPELIIEGDLCPHQDYVFVSRPTAAENRKITQYRERIQALFDELKADTLLVAAFEQHPIYQQPMEHLDWIYNNLEYYSATLIYLGSVGKEITEAHLEVIGDQKLQLPALDYEWIETLLHFYLYKDPENFSLYEVHQLKLVNKLRRNGAMERRSINFTQNRKINRFLSSSITKLNSIGQIVDFEFASLGQDLRMVVLTDYIRKEFLINQKENDLDLNKIGVMPIFEQLRRTNERDIKIGVLTGSLIIIPILAMEAFKEVAAQFGIEQLSTELLAFDHQYLIVNTTEQLKRDAVHIVTQIFQDGQIEVLVGTKSLLGEGWDAPAINALILASFVGSYVLSNQMRGRAIRTEKDNIDKTSNIWHLVCVDPGVSDGGEDIQVLKRRFKAFVGVSFREEISIENGMGRLNLPEKYTSEQEVSQINNVMLSCAGQRDQLKEKWRLALEGGASLIEEIKIPFPKDRNYKELKSLYYNRTIAYMFAVLASAMMTFGEIFFESFLRSVRDLTNWQSVLVWLISIGILGLIIFGGLLYRTLRLYLKYRDISKDAHQIGEALLASLIRVGAIHTDPSELTVFSKVNEIGAIYCHLEGATTYEKSLFIKSLQEIVGKVDNPRYLVIRKSTLLKLISQKDYHSVPEILGRKKQFATYFQMQWSRLVGACELVYTCTIAGRKMLLRSRMNSLASEFDEQSERVNKWR